MCEEKQSNLEYLKIKSALTELTAQVRELTKAISDLLTPLVRVEIKKKGR